MDILALLSTTFTLILVIAIFFGAYYVSKVVANSYQKNTIYSESIVQIIERKPIAKDQYLVVVKISDKIILLGSSAQHVDKLETFSSEEFSEYLKTDELNVENKDEFKENFKENFKDVLGKYVNNKNNK